MRRAGIVLVTVLALTAGGALVAPARAATPATPGRIDGLRGATRAIVVLSWSSRTTQAVVRTYQRARPGAGRLRHAAVINFNYRRPVYKKGSGIFLHQQTGGPTAGCVSLRPKDLVAVQRWLQPGTRIAMGPPGWLNRQ